MGDLKEIGAANAQIFGIRTIVDGSVRVTLDLLPQDNELIANLMQKKLSGNKAKQRTKVYENQLLLR